MVHAVEPLHLYIKKDLSSENHYFPSHVLTSFDKLQKSPDGVGSASMVLAVWNDQHFVICSPYSGDHVQDSRSCAMSYAEASVTPAPKWTRLEEVVVRAS
jgi:hypothetical protein